MPCASISATCWPRESFISAVAGSSNTRCGDGKVSATSAYIPAISAPVVVGDPDLGVHGARRGVELAGGPRHLAGERAPRIFAHRHPGGDARRTLGATS